MDSNPENKMIFIKLFSTEVSYNRFNLIYANLNEEDKV